MPPGPFFNPELPEHTQAFLRVAYGALLAVLLLLALPQSRRFFLSERFGGYAQSSPAIDLVQNPALLPLVLGLWFACAAMLIAGYQTVLFSFINLLLCRYFFVHMRWKGVLRGMGAPGFMTYWLAGLVFFLEYSLRADPDGSLRTLAVLAFQIDFAAIMLSAGLYKLVAGYRQNEGMELGLVNPWWGYWWRWYRRLPPGHLMLKAMNHLAYATEIGAGVLMLIPWTRFIGAMLIILSFAFTRANIRLGVLCEMVMLSCVVYFTAGSPGGRFMVWLVPEAMLHRADVYDVPGALNTAVAVFLWGYIILLPVAHAGLWYNFLARKAFPRLLQKLLELYANFFGIIIWRVFSVDVVNFFANIYVRDKATGEKRLYSRVSPFDWRSWFRYWHVGEFVCLASLFTTLKYYPNNPRLFHERLLRYAKTVPCPTGAVVVFEYIAIAKTTSRFEFVPAAEFVVDVHKEAVQEIIIDDRIPIRQAHRVSPVHAGARPGSYAPASSAPGSQA